MTYKEYYTSLDEKKRVCVAIAGRMFSVMHEAMFWLRASKGPESDEAYAPSKRFIAIAQCYAGLWRGFCEMCEFKWPSWQLEDIWNEHVKYGFCALPENVTRYRSAHDYLLGEAKRTEAPQPGGQA